VRDPFVLWNEASGEFWMLFIAELRVGPSGRRGCLGLLRSTDLTTWKVSEPFWSPFGAGLPECPDVFEWRGWWYLIFSAGGRTMYRRARQLGGPWHSDPMVAFDDRFFYAARSAGDHDRRLLFGWLAVKAGDRDAGEREWGGNLAVRELLQRADGSLAVKLPAEYLLTTPAPPRMPIEPRLGEWRCLADGIESAASDGFVYATIGAVAADAQIRLRVTPGRETRGLGLVRRASDDLATGYVLRLDRARRDLTLGPVHAPRELAQPLPELHDDVAFTITMAGSVVDVTVGERVTMIGRFHDHRGSTLALFVEEGSAAFRDVEIVPLTASCG
jgi:beta-fructofuranosidase